MFIVDHNDRSIRTYQKPICNGQVRVAIRELDDDKNGSFRQSPGRFGNTILLIITIYLLGGRSEF